MNEINDNPETDNIEATPIEPSKKKDKNKKKSILRMVIEAILYIAFVISLVYFAPKGLSAVLKTEYPMAAITSSSMWPVLKKGDLIFVEGIDPRTVQVDDIIVFANTSGAFTIHRVTELREERLVTKGDANNISDNPIHYEDIVGRLVKIGDRYARIPKLGFISTTASKYVQK